ncbi:MAG: OmpA family protein, partial [Leadbetterella sp.]|nr:OmpA family protein [Leadbetterella sp.]
YKATLKDEKWTDVVELPFNSDEYSVAHPTLSLDEKTLYFASNMPGTIGQSDLFRVSINTDGSFGTPENLGPRINTEGRETFPFISGDNELYFASDGHPGLGGLDVFTAKTKADNSFYMIQNVGEPVNSKQDDFGYVIDSKTSTGFFTSNREGGVGYDDIYKFKELKKLICTQTLSGIATDQDTGQPIAGAKVSLLDSNFKLLKETITDDKGFYSFEVACGETYYVRIEKEGYETQEGKVIIPERSGKTEHKLQMGKRNKPIDVGTDLAKILDMPIIYFDLDKSVIRRDAAFELEKILAVMEQYPKMKIDVRSHTDSRQTANYNQKLSDRRVKSTIAWLVQNKIQASRLTGRGYGESQLVNKCADGVKCTEEEHQANRRSEFVIISME